MSTAIAPVWDRIDEMAAEAANNLRDLIATAVEHGDDALAVDQTLFVLAAAGMTTADLRELVREAAHRRTKESRLEYLSTEGPKELTALQEKIAQLEFQSGRLRFDYEAAIKKVMDETQAAQAELSAKMRSNSDEAIHCEQILKRSADPARQEWWDWRNLDINWKAATLPSAK